MLVRAFSKLIVFLGPLLILGYLFSSFFSEDSEVPQQISQSLKSHNANEKDSTGLGGITPASWPPGFGETDGSLPLGSDHGETTAAGGAGGEGAVRVSPSPPQEHLPSTAYPVDENGDAIVNYLVYREVFSVSTPDRKFFVVNFGDAFPAINPNIIPHPHKSDAWIIVAQKEKSAFEDYIFEEIVCTAVFQPDGSLACSLPAAPLPVAPTHGNNCQGDLSYFSLNVGPHDMRVFYGPDAPYSIWGSQSAYTCFGLIAQDFRILIDEYGLEALTVNLFKDGTELQRPSPWGPVEKNWFLFWDTQGRVFVHHDVEPKRVFAQIAADGSVGPNLAPQAASTDDACMARYMPKPAPENENLHQATNSLSITLCKRSDATCQPTSDNTFVMTVFQYKTYHSWHGVYEPYVMLFKQIAPFSIHGISQKPIWIHGRGPLTKNTLSAKWKGEPDLPKDHSEMFYMTSMSWKAHGLKYHGYIDDVLFLGFGIEDSRAAAIDVLAGDLLQDLGLCGDAVSSFL